MHPHTRARARIYICSECTSTPPPFYASTGPIQQHVPRTAPIIQGDFSCGLPARRRLRCSVRTTRRYTTESRPDSRRYSVLRSRVIITLKSRNVQTITTNAEPRAAAGSLCGTARARDTRVNERAQCMNRDTASCKFLNAAFILRRCPSF